jgi:hypothetical protein
MCLSFTNTPMTLVASNMYNVQSLGCVSQQAGEYSSVNLIHAGCRFVVGMHLAVSCL